MRIKDSHVRVEQQSEIGAVAVKIYVYAIVFDIPHSNSKIYMYNTSQVHVQ